MTWHSIVNAIRGRQHRAHGDPGPFFTLSLDPLWITTLDGCFTRVNPAFTRTIGHSEAELLATSLLDLLHHEDRCRAAAPIAGLARGTPITDIESRFHCADGSYKWITWSSTPFHAEGSAYMVGHDRTRRKLDEAALRDAEARCVCAVENSTDAFFAVDRSWRLIRVNQQAEHLWMRDRNNVLGRRLWDVFPEAVDSRFHQVYQQAMETGAPAHLEEFYPHAPLDRWLEVHVYPSEEGLAVYFRDVTQRRRSEEKIQRALQEKEVLLREVHHRVKNNLQVICSMLRLQARYFHDEVLLQTLRDCRERVLVMALLHDQLHRAKDLSRIDLGEYLRSLAASLFCSYGVNSCEVDLHMDIEEITVSIDTAIPCGLIVNELVSNSLRHAFPGGKGRIRLGLRAVPGGQAELTVGDDGCGLPENDPAAATRSLGLHLVRLLAEQIGAEIDRSSDAGTRYRLVFQTTESRKEESDEQAPDHGG